MVWLPDGAKFSKISLFVLTQLTNLTDTHRQTPHDGIGRAYASHRAAKTAKRSSAYGAVFGSLIFMLVQLDRRPTIIIGLIVTLLFLLRDWLAMLQAGLYAVVRYVSVRPSVRHVHVSCQNE